MMLAVVYCDFRVFGAGEPSFLSPSDKPQSVNVSEGDQVRLRCNVSAEPEAQVVWLRNGRLLDRTYMSDCKKTNPFPRYVSKSY